MSTVEVKECVIRITEDDLECILRQVKKARQETEFIEQSTPMPDGNMAVEERIRERRRRGYILIKSAVKSMPQFEVQVEGVRTSKLVGEVQGWAYV